MAQILIEKNGIVIFKENGEKDILNIKFDIENNLSILKKSMKMKQILCYYVKIYLWI